MPVGAEALCWAEARRASRWRSRLPLKVAGPAARERGWYILVSDPLLVIPKTKTPGGAAVKGAGEGVAVKSNGVVVDGCEQPKLLSCELNCGMKLDPTSSRAEARLSGSAPLN